MRLTKLALGMLVIGVWVGPNNLYAQRQAIDVNRSSLTIRVFKSGIFSAFAHDHEIKAPLDEGGGRFFRQSNLRVSVDSTRNRPVAISPYFSPNSPLAGNPANELATLQKARTALAVSLRAGTTPAEMHTRLHQLRIVSDIGSPPRSQTPDGRSSAHVGSCRMSLRYTHLLIPECARANGYESSNGRLWWFLAKISI
jgi:hypothetical protein